MWSKVFFVCLLSALQQSSFGVDLKFRECSPRMPTAVSNWSSPYCVCNSTYCDDAPRISRPSGSFRSYVLISTSKDGLRFSTSTGSFRGSDAAPDIKPDASITVDPSMTYQDILGFGAAATDATGININSLPEAAQNEFIRSYFSEDGLEYTIIRVPMAGTDFSTRPYSYAMVENDTLLEYFALAEEDHRFKIPFIRRAMKLSRRPINLLASPWSPSPWMKARPTWTGSNTLKREYWHTWAFYFAKFFKEYQDQGLNFWALTPQNEPLNAFGALPINSMEWTVEDQRDWVVNFLVPILKKTGFENINIILVDGMRHLLPEWPQIFMNDSSTRKQFAGTGVHWYLDHSYSVDRLDETHDLFPDKFIIYTESCPDYDADLGSWYRAEQFAVSIIDTLNHWVVGWLDWNMALDERGGPNWNGNFMGAGVIVNGSAGEFYKQPTFYTMGHFSKYVPPGSVRIGTSNEGPFEIKTVAFRRPDNSTAIVFLNTHDSERIISVSDITKGAIEFSIPGQKQQTKNPSVTAQVWDHGVNGERVWLLYDPWTCVI
ncbi:lysosomal acid glucosylceramidase-like isoform X1 [Neodiprion virginianus]|uniref:lysosomal acid glucosylceramidase-like isoform X1 n=1 Tax=Neodiprion virginianus TaxID=2961670 RepID=UPI001EE76148|nr:lysosomal acid glucosylceramidase-like isoform X1 [Neodiprion virginianus]